MRLAFVSDSAFPWFNGGIEKRRFIIMRKLASRGHNVHCFTMYRRGMPEREFTYEGIRYHAVGEAAGWEGMYRGGGKRRSVSMPLHFAMRIFWKIFPYKFDVLDADSMPFLHIIPLYTYTIIRRITFAITWHEVWSRKFWKNYLGVAGNGGYLIEWVCAHIGNVHIANASATKELLTDELGVNPKKILVFPVALDREEISKALTKKVSKQNRFIVNSRLVKHKRVQLAIDAIADTNAKLTIVGTGPEEAELKRYADERAKGKVVFEHGISTERLYKEIRESRALLMLSEREGLSLATLEALALGTPVVIANTTSLPKELKSKCIQVDEKEIAELLRKMIKSPGGYDKRAKKLAAGVLSKFSGDDSERVYEEIIKR